MTPPDAPRVTWLFGHLPPSDLLMKHRLALLPVLPLLLLAGCGDDGGKGDDATTVGSTGTGGAEAGATETGTGDDPTGAAAGPTYWQEVAPIYFERCVSCHQAGGIGPFALDNYADAKTWAMAAAGSVEAKTMPPWLVTDDGSCGTFQDSRALPQAEIETIRAWVDAGAPEGEPRTDLAPPAPEVLGDATTYKTPKFSPEIQGGDLAEYDEYRCFRVETGLTADRFMTGYSVTPGVPAMIHHVLAITVDPEETGQGGMKNRDILTALDEQTPDRDGWPCFGAAGDGVSPRGIPVSWAPGQGVSELPAGVGYRIKQTDWLILQVHYNLVDPELKGSVDESAVHIRYADSVEREGYFDLPDDFLSSLFGGVPAQLEPGKASVEYTFDYDFSYLPFLGAKTADLYGVFPHMHQRGKKLKVELIEDGGAPQCAADVQNWDFGWQIYYFFDKALPVTPKSKLRITCDYDTTTAKTPVLPGWGTQNEMCLAGLFIVPNL